MRIGVLTTSYPRAGSDAAGLFVAGLARWLARRGARVEVLCAGAPGAPAVEVEPGGPTVRRLAYAWPRARERLFYRGGAPEALEAAPLLAGQAALFSARLLAAALRRGGAWDALVSHWLLPAGLAGALAARGRPHLAIAHSGDVHLLGRLGPLAGPLARRLGAPGTSLVFAAPGLRERFAAVAPDLARAARVEPMGIDAAALQDPAGRAAARAALGLAPGAFVVLFLGRLVPIKAVDLLLAAARGLPGAVVLVAGDGPAGAALAAAAPPGTRFLGAVAGPARARALAAADVVCLPSRVLPSGRSEGTPTVLFEAQAAGRPVVAAASGGLAQAVRDGIDGLLVPPGDPAALAAALARLAADPGLRAALAAAAAAAGPAHDWEAVAPRLLAPMIAACPGAARLFSSIQASRHVAPGAPPCDS
ncbi:MAG TPA: glycosyltransferase family 4 protein [Polyangia bacterium]